MERILRIAEQDYSVINSVEAPLISVDIIAPAADCHEADSGIRFP